MPIIHFQLIIISLFFSSQLEDGTIRGLWNLGDGEKVAHLDQYQVDNGEWHAIQFTRYDNYVTIKIDGGGGVRQIENRESTHQTLRVDPNSLMIGAFLQRAVEITQNFEGELLTVCYHILSS